MDWERFLESIVGIIRTKQNPAALLEIRGKYYELLARLIPASVILKRIASRLVDSTPSRATQMEIVHWAAVYDQKMRRGGKEIVPLEAFTARCMALLAQARHSCIVFYSKRSIHPSIQIIHSFLSFHSFTSISLSLTHTCITNKHFKDSTNPIPSSSFLIPPSPFQHPDSANARTESPPSAPQWLPESRTPSIHYPQQHTFYPERTGQTQIV